MPTLIELFRSKVITDGPNAGRTVESAYAVRNSKDVDIRTTNPILQGFADKLNKRRKSALRLGETRLEQEQVGLRTFGDTAKLILYGGDYFRIINGTTRSKQIMLKNAASTGAGLDDSIADKIGSAIGRFTGDKMQNLFLKREDRVPVKLDGTALGIDIAADVANRTLGRLLPDPMIPSKVADEFERRRGKKEEQFIHEFDTDKKIIKLKNQKGIPKLIDGLLKNNKDILTQSKDTIMSTVGTVAANLVGQGVRGLNNLIFNAKKDTLVGNDKTAVPTDATGNAFLYSSIKKYSQAKSSATLSNEDLELTGDLATHLIKARKLAISGRYRKLIETAKRIKVTTEPLTSLESKELNQVKLEPMKYSSEERNRISPEASYKVVSKDIRTLRGITNTGDAVNLNTQVNFSGLTQQINGQQGQTSLDDYDFIPMKFYSVGIDKSIQFRCTINNLVESFTPSWEANKFVGNAFNFYTYNGVERSVSFSFKVFSMNLIEHQLAWERLNELAFFTYPQSYKGLSNAVVPPILKFTLGNMYIGKDCFIDTLTYTVNEETPWEIGLNKKLVGGINPTVPLGSGYIAKDGYDANTFSDNYKLPMIVDVEMTLKFIESRGSTVFNGETLLYSYFKPAKNP